MELLEYILKILKIQGTDEIANEIGVIDRKIGSTYFVKPKEESYKAISITIINNRILNIGISLKKKYDLVKFGDEIGISPVVAYNNYDECTVINFQSQFFVVMIKLRGHIKLDSIENIVFDELDVRSLVN